MKNKVMMGCFCAICLAVVSGCKSAQKIEKGIRYAAADEVVRYMKKQKAYYVDEPCEGKERYFDQLTAEVRQLIVKE